MFLLMLTVHKFERKYLPLHCLISTKDCLYIRGTSQRAQSAEFALSWQCSACRVVGTGRLMGK